MPARTRPFERRNRASALHRRLTCTPSFSRSSRAPSASRRRTRRTSSFPACAEARACAGPMTASGLPSTRRAAQFAARATPLWCPRFPAHPAPARTVRHAFAWRHGDAPQHVGGEHFCGRCAALPLHARPLTLQRLTAAHPLQSDLVEWTLSYANADKSHAKRARHGPRRIVRIASRFVPRAPPLGLAAHPLPFPTLAGNQDRHGQQPQSGRPRALVRQAVNCRL